MTLWTRIAAISVAVVTAQAALADKLPLNAISSYLNDLRTAQGTFTQVNDDGTVDTGNIYIKRPGKMRFEYNAPNETLMIASANAVYIVDSKSNQPPETYPLRRTPLSLILARNVNLGQANMVVGHDFDGTATVVTAQDPEHPEYGNIEMKFTGNPVQLRQWVVNDSGGGQTTVVLGEMQTGGSLSNRLFDAPRRTSD
ncbi:outer membrane lipoprotein carrier protein LolA [uncultured Tateyamaria sp.]|uniref:LolA family protein n=1 Tax=uncultured Tateyamaria sp. TaxID=455651 RepID=UPI00261A32FC|nr:outer membrane lipoprotein carrier protein LolA [uncultured Tateyamaria sp.]